MSSIVSEEDRIDIRLSLEGDEDAFARIIKRYQRLIASQMWRFTRDKVELEELVADVFVEAYLSLKTFKGKAPFLHWLRKIATRVGYRFWKKKARDRDRKAELEENRRFEISDAENETPTEAAEMLHGLLEKLDHKDRLVLTLMYFEDCDTKEIAGRTGWSRSLVKVRAFRARNKLKKMLEAEGFKGV